jgi:hypothetical protein
MSPTPSRTYSDLYMSAGLLASGFRLVRTHRIAGRVAFEFEGDGLDDAVLQWTNKHLQVNAAKFTHALDRLRTLTYQGR